MTDPIPFYKQGRFIFAFGTVLVAAGLGCIAVLTGVEVKDIIKFVAGAYLGGPV